jgi:hypothetical protein
MTEMERRVTIGEAKQEAHGAYEVPRIVYEGVITTRAGSPVPQGGPGDILGPDGSVSPEDLFGKP